MEINRVPDKVNRDVLYYDKEHVYIDKDTKKKFISVTTLIHEYQNEFDEDFWSSYKALEKLVDDFSILKKTLLASKKFNDRLLDRIGVDPNEFYDTKNTILQEYEDKRNESCDRGTRIHSEFENSFYTKKTHSLKQYDLMGDFTCKKDYYELDLEKGIYPEYLVYCKSSDGNLNVAGQIDLLIKDGNDILIIDYKTNKEIKTKSYYNRSTKKTTNMKFPLNNIMDCNFYHYSLQLSLYAYMLQQINPEFNIKLLKLHHVDHNDKVTEYECEYLKNDVIRMLKHYKKQSIIKEKLNNNKPMIYG